MGNPKLKNELDTLKEDASQVVSDISNLAKVVGEVGTKKSKEASEDISKRAGEELEVLKERMKEIESRSKEVAKDVDSHVRQNPYLYILATLGLGVLVGKLLGLKNH